MHSKKLKTLIVLGLYILCIFPLFSDSSKADPSITIIKPSGGETYFFQCNCDIYWSSEDEGDWVSIKLYQSGKVKENIASQTDNDGYFRWIITRSYLGSDFYIKISDYENSYISDTSEYFTIKYQSIGVQSPTYSETWYKGEEYYITWTAELDEPFVDIELLWGDGYYNQIADNTPNDGKYLWEVPAYRESRSDYRIKIESVSGQYASDTSSYFTISEKQIYISSPTQGDVFRTGKKMQISWSGGVSGGGIRIDLYNGDSQWYLGSNDNDGSYSWEVPTGYTTSSNYYIKITSDSDNNNYAYSSHFTIKRMYIRVSSPYTNETLFKGQLKDIYWSSENAGNFVNISLYKSGEHFLTINSNSYNDGRESWEIPNNIPLDNKYQIKIRSFSVDDLFDITSFFTIDEHYIIVEKPEENETWYTGGIYNIQWKSKNINENVSISLFISGKYDKNSGNEGFITYNSKDTEIVYKTYNDGNFSWQIPNDISSEYIYKIQISEYGYGGISNYSGNFSIIKSIEIKSVTNYERWTTGETHNIYWGSSELVGNFVKIDLYKGNEFYSTIIENTTNDGNYNWEIPDSIDPASTYRLKISSKYNPEIYAFTKDYLEIDQPLLPQGIEIYILSIICFISAIVLVIFLIKRRIKPDGQNVSEIEEQIDKIKAPQDLRTFDISDEEYERIWENTKY